MYDGYIAEADDPFGALPELAEIEFIDNPDHAIPSSCAHNSGKRWIVEHHLHVFDTFIVSTAKSEIPGDGIQLTWTLPKGGWGNVNI